MLRSSQISLVQKLVLATNRWPVAGSVYRGIYKAAADSVVRLAEETPGIAGLYARNSYALGTWEPGRSDIDLTVVLREPSQSAIDRFHLAYAERRRRFPMLGEVEMIDARHLDAWTRHGIPGLHSQHWKKLAGDMTFQCQYSGSEEIDRVRHAVAVYRYQFLRYFWEGPRHKQAALRAVGKIMRTLGLRPTSEGSSDRLLVHCLQEISRTVRAAVKPGDGPLVNYPSLIGSVAEPSSGCSGRAPGTNGAEAVIASGDDLAPKHVLVSGEFDLAKIKSDFPQALIWDRDVFCFYLCFVDPLEYFALLQERTILCGDDPLREPFPLQEDALRNTICHYSVDMLTYPYRTDLLRLSAKEFEDILYGWFLRTLRYFEEGVLDFDYYSLRQYFGDRHVEGVDRFLLLHGIAEDLSHHLRVESCEAIAQTR